MSAPPDRRFWVLHALLPLLLFLALAVLFEATDLDLVLSDPFYDAGRGGWVHKRSWWADGVIHKGGRDLVLALSLGLLSAWLLSFRLERLRPWRRQALYMILVIALGTGAVALGKATIDRHCPWDYDRYGGEVPYVRLFEPVPPGFERGHGFPAGHASGGYALVGSYFLFYGRSRRRSLAGLALGLGLGSLFGFGQLARGAHFASHNLWSAALCWYASLVLFLLMRPDLRAISRGDGIAGVDTAAGTELECRTAPAAPGRRTGENDRCATP